MSVGRLDRFKFIIGKYYSLVSSRQKLFHINFAYLLIVRFEKSVDFKWIGNEKYVSLLRLRPFFPLVLYIGIIH